MDSIAFWDAKEGKWVVFEGTYQLLVASSPSPKDV
jgi:hypothetical protein